MLDACELDCSFATWNYNHASHITLIRIQIQPSVTNCLPLNQIVHIKSIAFT